MYICICISLVPTATKKNRRIETPSLIDMLGYLI